MHFFALKKKNPLERFFYSRRLASPKHNFRCWRLVVLVNPENAQSFWRPDYKGMDWQDYTNMGKEISEMFLALVSENWGGCGWCGDVRSWCNFQQSCEMILISGDEQWPRPGIFAVYRGFCTYYRIIQIILISHDKDPCEQQWNVSRGFWTLLIWDHTPDPWMGGHFLLQPVVRFILLDDIGCMQSTEVQDRNRHNSKNDTRNCFSGNSSYTLED